MKKFYTPEEVMAMELLVLQQKANSRRIGRDRDILKKKKGA